MVKEKETLDEIVEDTTGADVEALYAEVASELRISVKLVRLVVQKLEEKLAPEPEAPALV